METTVDVLVIGGGIAGLAAAWELHRTGENVLLLEAAPRVGGLIRTKSGGGFVSECGPNSFLGSAESLLALANEVGLGPEIIETPRQAAERFIFFRGRLHPVPRGPRSFISSNLLTWRGKLRLLGELFIPAVRNSSPLMGEDKGGGETTDETVSDFVRRRLGSEALDRLIDPLVAGIFAGDPDRLSLRAAFPKMAALERDYGGLFKGAIRGGKQWQSRSVRSFRNGMESLPAAIANKLGDAIVNGATVDGLAREPDGAFAVRGLLNGEPTQWRARRVVCATPAQITAAIIHALAPIAAAPLREIIYAPVVVVHVAYECGKCPRPLNGFGFLVPRREPVHLLGSLWTSSCFPNRAPADIFFSTCFFGGMRDPSFCDADDEQISETLARDVRATMGIGPHGQVCGNQSSEHREREGEAPQALPVEGATRAPAIDAAPVHLKIIRHRAAIPQYTVGHQRRIAAINAAVSAVPGLYLTGNYFTGTSVNDTIAHATTIATQPS